MIRSRTVLLTGATGILGSWVLGGALERGYRVITLLRDPTIEHAQNRISAVLRFLGRSHQTERIQIALGDTSKERFGLTDSEYDRLRATAGTMIHCAASISFHPKHDADVWKTNVGGVQQVLDFVSGANIDLYHVSTAFVAGRRRGLVLESELNVGQEFVNTYERSKCTSEGMVNDAVTAGRVRAAIMRPAIIVGATRNGRISQFQNFYRFLQLLDSDLSSRAGSEGRVRILANALGTLNLAPVDWTAEALWRIIDAEGSSGKTYHLTNPEPPTHGGILRWVSEFISDVTFEPVNELCGAVSRAETLVRGALRHYIDYLNDQPVFDRTNTDCALRGQLPFPAFHPEFCGTLLDYARKRGWQSIFAENEQIAGLPAIQSLAG
jgi:thioester reductase-like protein